MEHDIILLCLPPHTTHESQPLDVGVFAPLKTQWSQVCDDFYQKNPGRVITKFNFSRLFSEAWNRAVLPSNVMAGFHRAGVYPFNPKAIAVPENDSSLSGASPQSSGGLSRLSPQSLGSLSGASPQSSGSLSGASPQSSGSLLGASPQSSGSLSGASPQSSGSLSGASPQSLGSLSGGSPQSLGSLSGASPQSLGSLSGGSPQSSGSLSGGSPQSSGSLSGASPQSSGSLSGTSGGMSDSSTCQCSPTFTSEGGGTKPQEQHTGSSVQALYSSSGLKTLAWSKLLIFTSKKLTL